MISLELVSLIFTTGIGTRDLGVVKLVNSNGITTSTGITTTLYTEEGSKFKVFCRSG